MPTPLDLNRLRCDCKVAGGDWISSPWPSWFPFVCLACTLQMCSIINVLTVVHTYIYIYYILNIHHRHNMTIDHVVIQHQQPVRAVAGAHRFPIPHYMNCVIVWPTMCNVATGHGLASSFITSAYGVDLLFLWHPPNADKDHLADARKSHISFSWVVVNVPWSQYVLRRVVCMCLGCLGHGPWSIVLH